jgi:hypothetical protein
MRHGPGTPIEEELKSADSNSFIFNTPFSNSYGAETHPSFCLARSSPEQTRGVPSKSGIIPGRRMPFVAQGSLFSPAACNRIEKPQRSKTNAALQLLPSDFDVTQSNPGRCLTVSARFVMMQLCDEPGNCA